MKVKAMVLFGVLVGVACARAEVCTFSGSGNWNDASHWDTLPVDGRGDTLVLSGTGVNDFAAGFSVAAVSFSGAASFSGNALTVSGGSGLTVSAAQEVVVGLPITFTADQTWSVIGGATLRLNASCTFGSHTLTIVAPEAKKPGNIYLNCANEISGLITLKQGIVYVCADNALGTGKVSARVLASDNFLLYGRVVLCGVTIPNAFTLIESNGGGANPAISCLSSTTNTILGAVEYSSWPSSCHPIVPSTSQLVFAGGVTMAGSCAWFRSGVYSDGMSGYVVISNTPCALKSICHTTSWPYASIRFAVAGNTVGSNNINLSNTKCRLAFDVDEAFDNANSTYSILNFQGTIDLNGTTQHLRGFKSQAAGKGTIKSDAPATLYMDNLFAETAYSGALTGPVNFSKYGSYKMTLSGSGITSTGYLEASGGVLELASSIAWAGTDLRVTASEGDATLSIPSNPTLDPNVVLTIDDDDHAAAVALGSGTVLVVKGLSVNGVAKGDGKYGSAAAKAIYPSITVDPHFTGEGYVQVVANRNPQVCTFSGSGNWDDASHWDTLPVDGRGDTLVLSGTGVNDFDAGFSVAAVSFSGAASFSGNALTVSGGSGLTVSAAQEVVVGLPITFTANQTWSVIGGATLRLNASCTFGSHTWTIVAPSTKSPGNIYLNCANEITGDVTLKQGIVYVCADNALGTGKVWERTLTDSFLYGRVVLCGVTIPNAFSLIDSNGGGAKPAISCLANTTNTILGAVEYSSWPSSCHPIVPLTSQLVFAGGVTMGGSCAWFRSGVYGDGMSGYVVISNTPCALKSICNGTVWPNTSIRFAVAGNTVGANNINLVNARGRLAFDVDEAFDNANSTYSILNFQGTIDLNGTTQHLRGFKSQAAGKGTIKSDAPAMLYMDNLFEATAYSGTMAGALGFSKCGAFAMSLDGANITATGRLEVTEGDLSLGTKLVWRGTDVVVAGTNAAGKVAGNLVVSAFGNLKRDSVLKLYGDGTVTVPDGVQVSVKEAYRGGSSESLVRLEPGSYTKSNCAFVLGDGVLRVRGQGLNVILR